MSDGATRLQVRPYWLIFQQAWVGVLALAAVGVFTGLAVTLNQTGAGVVWALILFIVAAWWLWASVGTRFVIGSQGVAWRDSLSSGSLSWANIESVQLVVPVGFSIPPLPPMRFTALCLRDRNQSVHVVLAGSQLAGSTRDRLYRLLLASASDKGVPIEFNREDLTTALQNAPFRDRQPYGFQRWKVPVIRYSARQGVGDIRGRRS